MIGIITAVVGVAIFMVIANGGDIASTTSAGTAERVHEDSVVELMDEQHAVGMFD